MTEQEPDEAPLTPPTRAVFLSRLDQLTSLSPLPPTLPPWAQSGPYGWPAPCANETAYFFFQVGWHGLGILEVQVLPPLTNLGNAIKNWILSRFDQYESPEQLADAYEDWALANNTTPWAEEVP